MTDYADLKAKAEAAKESWNSGREYEVAVGCLSLLAENERLRRASDVREIEDIHNMACANGRGAHFCDFEDCETCAEKVAALQEGKPA